MVYGETRISDDGIPITNINWKQEVSTKLHQLVEERIEGHEKVKIDGARATWVLCNIVNTCKRSGIENISAYDIRTASYIPIKKLDVKETRETKGLRYSVVESNEAVFLDIDIPTGTYNLEDYNDCVIPQIDESKKLYVSGRLPLWLYTAIATSYDSTEKFAFQPGVGFTCFDSEKVAELGEIVQEPEGINLVEYYMQKKENELKREEEKKQKGRNVRVLLSPTYLTDDELSKRGIVADATVEAEYGERVIKGKQVTLAHHTQEYKNKPSPCNTPNVPILNNNSTILVSHLDLDTLGRNCCFNGNKKR